MSFVLKQTERVVYLFLLASLALGRIVIEILILLAPLFKRKATKDFLFFPYAHKDNSGTVSRFQEYFPFLNQDQITFEIHYPSTLKEYDQIFHSHSKTRIREYRYYHKLFWQRLFWVMKAPRFKGVFFQRALFPEYYDQKKPVLEKLLFRLHDNITVDYFDADYARNENFYREIVRYCTKVSVVNGFLYQYYSQLHQRVFYNDLSIDCSRYTAKENFSIDGVVRIFWTGGIGNAQHLKVVMPALEALSLERDIRLVMVCKTTAGYNQNFIEHHLWNPETFNELLSGSDIAIYPAAEDNAYSRGKVAYKCLEYAAARLPIVASPQGLSSRFEAGKDAAIVYDQSRWAEALNKVIQDIEYRKKLANGAYKQVNTYHDVKVTYKRFLEILNA